MKSRDIRASNKEDLDKKVDDMRKELIKIRMQVATGTAIKNPGQIKKLKKTIARILTETSKKEITIKKSAKKANKQNKGDEKEKKTK